MTTYFGFLLFPHFEDLDLVGPWEMIATWSKKFNGPKHVFTVAETHATVPSYKGLTLQPDYSFDDCPKLDFLLVPGGQGTRTEVNNKKLIEFIHSQAKNCQHILSVCTGAFLLQAAGLLTGRKATTHWESINRLKAFSEITVVEKRFVRDGNIWTSAGVSAGIDMALAFIAELAGEKTAGAIQLFSEYYPDTKIYPNDRNILPNYVEIKK